MIAKVKNVKPTVLIATTTRWIPTARLALALSEAGFTVDAVCASGHPLFKTRGTRQIHKYHGLSPLSSFSAAVGASRPDLIIPGDDLATRQLHQLHQREQSNGEAGAAICAIIERSLGVPENFPAMFARSAFMDLVQETGIVCPRTEVMANSDDLKRFAALAGFPFVLKADGTSGGRGVKIVYSLEEAAGALRVLSAPPTLPRAAKHAVVDMDFTLLRPSLTRRRAVVNAQAFVPGREATSAIACLNGKVLASLHFEVIEKAHKLGHASVLRLVENREMTLAADRIVRRLSLSGIFGLDFMLERGGKAQLIEINPRATQIGHLTLGPGRDLPAALYAAVSGTDLKAAPKVTEKDIIALFPQEWIRDSDSPFLASGYHDVPWQQPQLVQACVLSRRKQSKWYSKRGESKLPDASTAAMISTPANEPQPICDLSPIRLERIPNNIVNGDF
jgi:hypothetical protein